MPANHDPTDDIFVRRPEGSGNDDRPDTPVDADDGDRADPPNAPAPALAPEEAAGRSGPSSTLLIGASVAVALIVIAVIVVALLNKDEGAPSGSDGSSEQAEPAWPAALNWKPKVLGERGQGIDAITAAAQPGVYVWSDFDGWFLLVVDPSGKAAAKGKLVSDAELSEPTMIEGSEGLAVVEGNTITYDLSTATGRAAGFHFGPGFFAKTVSVLPDGTDLPLFLGGEATVTQLPHTITKQAGG